MRFFISALVLGIFGSASAAVAQAPRFALDIGGGFETTQGGDYRMTSGNTINALVSLRVTQVNATAVQLIASHSIVDYVGDVTTICAFSAHGGCAPAAVDGWRTTVGIAFERQPYSRLSVRAGGSIGWFEGTNTHGAGAHAYPMFAEAIVPCVPHLAAFAIVEHTFLRDLGGDNITMRSTSFGIRIY